MPACKAIPIASTLAAPLILPELGAGVDAPGVLGPVLDAAARYLVALAGRRGALVVFEDLHWADTASLTLGNQVTAGAGTILTDSGTTLTLTGNIGGATGSLTRCQARPL